MQATRPSTDKSQKERPPLFGRKSFPYRPCLQHQSRKVYTRISRKNHCHLVSCLSWVVNLTLSLYCCPHPPDYIILPPPARVTLLHVRYLRVSYISAILTPLTPRLSREVKMLFWPLLSTRSPSSFPWTQLLILSQ